ncbi:MAG: hydroxyisourate hydrolase [Gammaproteobacteria bacterium]|jgi:5-hydroxyisourate hydrolase
MSQITTHILDTSRGMPASNVSVALFREDNAAWNQIAHGQTDQDGRIGNWLGEEMLPAGNYKLYFAVADYFARNHSDTFYPYIEIVFAVAAGGEHYHVPLLLNPFGYSTYRGS